MVSLWREELQEWKVGVGEENSRNSSGAIGAVIMAHGLEEEGIKMAHHAVTRRGGPYCDLALAAYVRALEARNPRWDERSEVREGHDGRGHSNWGKGFCYRG